MEQVDPNLETPISYYNKTRKRSFFFSRMFVMLSMVVLVIALSVNISFLYSQERTTTTSHASTPESEQVALPSLAAGCTYQPATNSKGYKVVCPTSLPTQSAQTATASAASIIVTLPNLPPQCQYAVSTNGYSLRCTALQAPIPTVAVTLPQSCSVTANQSNPIQCTNEKDTSIITTIPKLPSGCVYKGIGSKTYVVCTAQ